MARKVEAEKQDPRPVATDGCADCLALPGQPHELSCDEVSPEVFRAFLGITDADQ